MIPIEPFVGYDENLKKFYLTELSEDDRNLVALAGRVFDIEEEERSFIH